MLHSKVRPRQYLALAYSSDSSFNHPHLPLFLLLLLLLIPHRPFRLHSPILLYSTAQQLFSEIVDWSRSTQEFLPTHPLHSAFLPLFLFLMAIPSILQINRVAWHSQNPVLKRSSTCTTISGPTPVHETSIFHRVMCEGIIFVFYCSYCSFFFITYVAGNFMIHIMNGISLLCI